MVENRLTDADLLLITLAKIEGDGRFTRGPDLARALDVASGKCDLYRAFRWNPDYQSSRKLNEALNLLDLTGMVVGENMPTQFFRLTNQARDRYAKKLEQSLTQEQRAKVEEVVRDISAELSRSSTR